MKALNILNEKKRFFLWFSIGVCKCIFLVGGFFISSITFAQDYLVATCDGAGGYCNTGSNVTIHYKSGGGNKIGPRAPSFTLGSDIVLTYCNSTDGINIPSTTGCIDFVRTGLPNGMEGQPWSSLNGYVLGTFRVPNNPPFNSGSGRKCIAVYISDRGYGGGFIARSYGTSTQASSSAICSGYAPPPPPPDLCLIDNGSAISVNFGNTERADIPTSVGGHTDIQKNLQVSCQGGGTHGINVRLSMSPTVWDNKQIATSNNTLGVSISADGRQLNNNDGFNITVNGSGSKKLTFSLLRDPNKKISEVATGPFTSSATLIVTEP